MHQFDLKNKTAIITGGAQGFGLDIAKRFLKSGTKAIIWDIDEEELKKAVKAVNDPNLLYNVVDVSDFKNVKDTVDEIANSSNIDILINNAGITKDNLLMRMNEEDFDKVIEVNLKSVFNMVKAVQRTFLKNRKGSIINISSIVGVKGNAGQSNYAASKAGIIGFSKSVALELGSRNIRSNVIAPGFIQTEMTDKLNEDVVNQWISAIPLKRGGIPEDVANLCLFLASDLSTFITGQVINVDGGMLT